MGTAVSIVHESSCPELGPICLTRDEPPQLHHQSHALLELRATAAMGFTERLGGELSIPWRVTRSSIRYSTLDGTFIALDYPDIHHRDETLSGMGDPFVMARFREPFSEVVTFRLGTSVPLGRTEANPFELARQGREHQHVQFGSGTFDPLLGVDARWRWGDKDLGLLAFARLPLYANPHGYQAGSRILGRLELGLSLLDQLRGVLGVDVATELPERWNGLLEAEAGSGRVDTMTRLGLGYSAGDFLWFIDAWVLVHQAMLPGPKDAHAEHLRFPLALQLGVRHSLALGDESPRP